MKKLSLYQIKNGFMELNNADDISEEDKIKINDQLNIALKEKSSDIIWYHFQNKDLIEQVDNEIKRLQAFKKFLLNRDERYNNYVMQNMKQLGIEKIETKGGSVQVAKSPLSVEITDENKIPTDFLKIEMVQKVDKNKIKEEFKKTGEVLDGVKYNTNNTYLKFN
jgi:hypothetical protein